MIEIVPSTYLAAAMIGAMLAMGQRRGLLMFFAMMPLGAAAAFNLPAVGGASFGIKELAVIALLGAVVFAPRGVDATLGTLRPGQPGALALLLLLYALISALWVPTIFQGMTEVFTISRSVNTNGIIAIPLRPTSGNITQLFAITISLGAFLALATQARKFPDPARIVGAMAIATAINFALGLADVASAALGQSWLLDPLRTANYSILSEARVMGVKRMIGGFPEASSFGSFSMGLLGFWLHQLLAGQRTRLSAVMLAVALLCVLRSTSSGAYVALAIFASGYALWWLAGGAVRRVSRRAGIVAVAALLAGWSAVAVLAAAYFADGAVTIYLDQILFDKLGSASGVERMSWNLQALRNFWETALIGAGLGSARASNWLLSSLGSIGLPGTLLFLAFLMAIFRIRTLEAGPATAAGVTVTALKSACAATLASELLIASTPNLGVFFFALAGLATGLARSTQVVRPAPAPAPRVPAPA